MYVGYAKCPWHVLVIIFSNTEEKGVNVYVWLGAYVTVQQSQEPVGRFEPDLQIDIIFGDD